MAFVLLQMSLEIGRRLHVMRNFFSSVNMVRHFPRHYFLKGFLLIATKHTYLQDKYQMRFDPPFDFSFVQHNLILGITNPSSFLVFFLYSQFVYRNLHTLLIYINL
jgi:hypothetical protein